MPTTFSARLSAARVAACVRCSLPAALVLCASFLVTTLSHAGETRLRVGEPPPDLIWVSVTGDTLSWDSLRQDRPLIMVFWATWCAVCKNAWPKLAELADRYHDAPIAPVWAAVSLGEDPDKVARVAAKRKLPGLIIADPTEINGDALGVEFVPTVYILDRKGRLAYMGSPKIARLNKLLEQLTSSTKEALQ